MRRAFLVALVLFFLPAPEAEAEAGSPSVKSPAPPVEPVSLDIKAIARTEAPEKIPPAKQYAQARQLLARGKAAAALKALGKETNGLLGDRIALLTGDALLALGQQDKAREAYLEAFESAQVAVVKYRAAKGLANVLRQLKMFEEQVRYLDALLQVRDIAGRPNLMLDRALALERIGREEEAASGAWRILLDYPTMRVATEAGKLFERLGKKGVKTPVSTDRLELVRIKNLWRSGSYARAEQALTKLEKKAPKLKERIDLERLEILRFRGKKREELALLTELYSKGVREANGAHVLERLGKLSMSQDRNEDAIKYFEELATRFPKSRRAAEGMFLASWLPYNDGQFQQASDRFLGFADAYPKWDRRPEALWFAGWSAYLGNDNAKSKAILKRILEEHPDSQLTQWSNYWTARIFEQEGNKDEARRWYREVLKKDLLGYYPQWAITRLRHLGETIEIKPSKTESPASVEAVLKLLGAERPITVDRAVALHSAGVEKEGLEELEAAHGTLAKIRDTRGRVMVAEMLDALGDHHQAFKMAMAIVQDGTDLVSGKPYAWRAWRLAYPKAFWKEVEAAAKAHDVDPLFVLSIMRTESHFIPWAKSRVGARGLMQIMPATAKHIGRRADGGRGHAARYHEPASNVWLGAWYLRQLLKRYGGQMAPAAGAYNAGPGAADRWMEKNGDRDLDEWIEAVSYRETRRYVRRVLETYFIYRSLEGLGDVDFSGPVKRFEAPKDSVDF